MAKKKDIEENSGKSNKGMMIILFVLGLVVLGASAFGGMYLFMRNNSTPKEVIIEEKYIDLEEFTINLGDKGGKRFFRGELSLGFDKTDTKVEAEISENTVVIRDAIIFYFKAQQSDYINDVANKDKIKEELIENINSELQKGKITDIRFKNMIVQ